MRVQLIITDPSPKGDGLVSMNANKWDQARARKLWGAQAYALVRSADLTQVVWNGRVTAVHTVYQKGCGLDINNCAPNTKGLVDGAVRAGLLRDDSTEYVRGDAHVDGGKAPIDYIITTFSDGHDGPTLILGRPPTGAQIQLAQARKTAATQARKIQRQRQPTKPRATSKPTKPPPSIVAATTTATSIISLWYGATIMETATITTALTTSAVVVSVLTSRNI